MKVKNILFSGVMAAILGATGANAAINVASQGYVDSKVGVNTQSIATLTQTVADNKSAAETAIADAKKAGTDAAAALETYKGTNDAAVKAAQDAADAAQSDVDALETTVGTLPEGAASVVAYINTKTEGIATDAALGELQAQVTENTDDIATLTGSGEGSVSKAIADAVAGMSAEGGAVKENADAIAALEGLVGETSVESQITAATTDMATNASVAQDIADAISGKANTADVYSKTDADTKFATNEALNAVKTTADAAATKAYVDTEFAKYTTTEALSTTLDTFATKQALENEKTAREAADEATTEALKDYTKTVDLDKDFVSESEMTQFKTDNTAAINAKVAQSDYDDKVAALEAKDAELVADLAKKIEMPAACQNTYCVLSVNGETISWMPLTEPVSEFNK